MRWMTACSWMATSDESSGSGPSTLANDTDAPPPPVTAGKGPELGEGAELDVACTAAWEDDDDGDGDAAEEEDVDDDDDDEEEGYDEDDETGEVGPATVASWSSA